MSSKLVTKDAVAEAAPGGEVQSVASALRLLETVAVHAGLGMRDLSERAGMTLNQTHRLLSTLEKRGYVSRDPDRSYHLGPQVALLAQGEGRYRRLIAAAQGALDTLSALSSESVLLAVRVGLERVVVDRRLSSFSLRVDWAVGSRLPLHVGGLGVALLAYAPTGVLEALLQRGPERFTAHTLVSETALRAELESVRRTGVRISVDDYAVGEFSVAAPVLDAGGEAVAAVNIAGFTPRLSDEKRGHYQEAVRGAAVQIAEALRKSGAAGV